MGNVTICPDHYTESPRVIQWVERFIEDCVEEKFMRDGPMKEFRRKRLSHTKAVLYKTLNFGVTEVGEHLVKKVVDSRNKPHIFVGPKDGQRNVEMKPFYRYETMFGAERKKKIYDPEWRDSVKFKYETREWGLSKNSQGICELTLKAPKKDKRRLLPEIQYRGLSLADVLQMRREVSKLTSELDKYASYLSKRNTLDKILTDLEPS